MWVRRATELFAVGLAVMLGMLFTEKPAHAKTLRRHCE
jgi:hypothetical protein